MAEPAQKVPTGSRRTDLRRYALGAPDDVAAFAADLAHGRLDPHAIVAVIGKTHGNGLVNDYTRGHLTLALLTALSDATGLPRDVFQARIPFIFSGGVEGVLSPHFCVFSVTDAVSASAGARGLAVGVAHSAAMALDDIGRERQIAATASAVTEAMTAAGLGPAEVAFVQVKGPAPSGASLARAATPPASTDPNRLMALGRAACALGVARALGEVPPARLVEQALLRDRDVFSRVASISAGVEVAVNEVVVLGMGAGWAPGLAIASAPLADALDVSGLLACCRTLGLTPWPGPAERQARLRAAFVKAEPSRDGLIRGRAHTMLDDGDISAQRHIRAAAGAVAAAALGETAIFVSGGAEHQGPDGGGLVAVIAETD